MLSNAEKEIVRSSFLFSGFSPEEFADVSDHVLFRCVAYNKGVEIYSPEHHQQALGIVLSGRVRVTKGGGNLVVDSLGVGDLFGAEVLFNPDAVYTSTLCAKTPCRVVMLAEDDLKMLIEQEPRVCWNFIYYQTKQLRFLSDKVDHLIQGSGAKKLTSYLLQQVGEDGVVQLDCSMTELAARLRVSRAALYRDLSRLESDGLVQRKGKEITLLDPGLMSLQ